MGDRKQLSPDESVSNPNDPSKFLKDLSFFMKNNQNKKVDDLLKQIKVYKHIVKDVNNYGEGEDNTETLLHVAVKYEDDISIIRRIVRICPDLLTKSRESSVNYKGQTALHIAITRMNNRVIEMLLSEAENRESKKLMIGGTKSKMLNTRATGTIFANTVMMGELPLSVAALTFNTEVVSFLHSEGAEMHTQNNSGDTVLHSLVKYSAVYPEKIDDVIKMLKHINSILKERTHQNRSPQEIESDISIEDFSYLWFVENKEHLTPLQLSAKYGLVEVFQFIINLENVYSFISSDDGLFDVKLYDITEIDTVANQQLSSTNSQNGESVKKKVHKNIDGVPHTNIETNTPCNSLEFNSFDYPEAESILEMMFAYDYRSTSAFKIIETTPVKNVIQEKWRKLRAIYFVWGFIHTLLTITLTAELVIRSNIYARETIEPNTTFKTDMFDMFAVSNLSKVFAEVIFWIGVGLGGIVYSMLVILLLTAKCRRPNALRYTFHNLGYISFLFMFSVCLIADFFMTRWQSSHDNIALIVAIITGWWFAVFFLRAVQLFSFFTEMIRRVIVGDLLRFSVIISFMMFAFTAGMYAVFIGKLNKEHQQPSSNYFYIIEDNFDSYGTTLLTMFKLMLGLGDIEVLNQARLPGLAIALFVVFTILTYVLLMNSLIAMMSQTCAIVLEDRYPQWRLQQVSVILFLEDLFCLPCIRYLFGSPGNQKQIYRFDPATRNTKTYSRYFLTIHSLQTTYASDEDLDALEKTTHFSDKDRTRPEGRYEDDIGTLEKTVHEQLRLFKTLARQTNKTPNNSNASDEGKDTLNTKVTKPKRPRRDKTRNAPDMESVLQTLDILFTQLNRVYKDKSRRKPLQNHHLSPPLTPVDSNIHIHKHDDQCSERLNRSGTSSHLHIDIEPYSGTH